MRHLLLLFLAFFLSSAGLWADDRQDFVAQLVVQLQDSTEEVQDKDYQCITVSPGMMEKMLEMMQSSNEEYFKNEKIQKSLPNIKSLRIFIATQHPEKYKQEVERLLDKKKRVYQPYKNDLNDKNEPCVWLRRNKNKIIEIIAMQHQDNNEENSLKVVDFTGNLTHEFVSELLKM
ncbi:MAG: DUF4252 domain-containing protein [Bacteroidaceae bacterium]|nr:DUF4252 domain-containing protein [Bacteroidaceae bacterium]